MAIMTENQPLPWYKQFWPWFLIMLPMTAVIGGIITIKIAIDNKVGLVKEDYYDEGLSINDQIARDQAAVQAGIKANLLFSDIDQQITLFLQGNLPQTVNKLTLTLSAPIDPNKDRTILLSSSNGQLFQSGIPAGEALSGRYYLELEPENKAWRIKGEVQLPSTEPFQLP